MKALHAVVAGALLAAAASQAAPAPPRFLYFRADGGVAAGAGPLPDRFESPEALLWRAPLADGQSTPVVCGGKVFVTVANPATQSLATLALDRDTGKVLWTRPQPVRKIEIFHPQSGSAAPSTPACDGERLYVFFGSYGLLCYDLDGKQLWDLPLGPFQEEYGAGSSPMLAGNKVILNEDHDLDSFLIAVDRFTGKVLWRTPRPDAIRSYSTPRLWQRGGTEELLVAGALELSSYDPSNGQKLWSTHGLARIVIPLPAMDGSKVYMASWSPGGDAQARVSLDAWPAALEKWDLNKNGRLTKEEIKDANVLERFYRMDIDQNQELNESEWTRYADIFRRARNAVLAIQPGSHRGELPESDVVWSYPKGVPYVASPILDKGVLWMVKDGGIVTRLDVETGRSLSEERLNAPGSYFSSPITGDGKVYFCSDQGVVTVVANEPQWRPISAHSFHEKIHATPVIEGNRIYLRTAKALYCFQGK